MKTVYDNNSLINMTIDEYKIEISNFTNKSKVMQRHLDDKHIPPNIKEFARKLLSKEKTNE